MSRRPRWAASTARPRISAQLGVARRRARLARRLRGAAPGAGTSPTIATPGRSCAAPTIAAVGLILDSVPHRWRGARAIEAIRAIPGDRIFLVQLADAPRLDLDVAVMEPAFPLLPRSGRAAGGGLHARPSPATGYSGALSLEIFNDQFRAGSAARVARDGMRSLLALRRPASASNRCRRVSPRRASALSNSLSTKPPPRTWAFSCAGSVSAGPAAHRSKAVDRWSQRAINLVVNAESDGFAHSHYITHGPGVCAIGIETADVARDDGARRSPAGAVSFRQKVGHGELEIPAIRGVGGSLLYFLERKGLLGEVWEREFFAGRRRRSRRGPLVRIDHIAQSMPYDEMLSWLLFYESIFDLKRLPQQRHRRSRRAGAEPGAGQSPTIRCASCSTARLRRARCRRAFLSEFFGSGVQHVAFATDDIFGAVAQMRAQTA